MCEMCISRIYVVSAIYSYVESAVFKNVVGGVAETWPSHSAVIGNLNISGTSLEDSRGILLRLCRPRVRSHDLAL